MATSHSYTAENSYVSVKFHKNCGQVGGKLKTQDTESTRLQDLSLMNSAFLGAIHYDILLGMNLEYIISRIFQEMSLSDLETLHHLCENERTQILQSPALAVLKTPYIVYLLSRIRSNFIGYGGSFLWYYTCTKKVSTLLFLKINDVIKETQYSSKIKFILLINIQEELTFGIQQSHVDQKKQQ